MMLTCQSRCALRLRVIQCYSTARHTAPPGSSCGVGLAGAASESIWGGCSSSWLSGRERSQLRISACSCDGDNRALATARALKRSACDSVPSSACTQARTRAGVPRVARLSERGPVGAQRLRGRDGAQASLRVSRPYPGLRRYVGSTGKSARDHPCHSFEANSGRTDGCQRGKRAQRARARDGGRMRGLGRATVGVPLGDARAAEHVATRQQRVLLARPRSRVLTRWHTHAHRTRTRTHTHARIRSASLLTRLGAGAPCGQGISRTRRQSRCARPHPETKARGIRAGPARPARGHRLAVLRSLS